MGVETPPPNSLPSLQPPFLDTWPHSSDARYLNLRRQQVQARSQKPTHTVGTSRVSTPPRPTKEHDLGSSASSRPVRPRWGENNKRLKCLESGQDGRPWCQGRQGGQSTPKHHSGVFRLFERGAISEWLAWPCYQIGIIVVLEFMHNKAAFLGMSMVHNSIRAQVQVLPARLPYHREGLQYRHYMVLERSVHHARSLLLLNR